MVSYCTRREALAAGLGVALTGCSGATPTDAPAGVQETKTSQSSRTGEPTGPPTRAQLPVPHEFAKLREAVVSGGVGKDGIPSIDDPSFVAPEDTPNWLGESELVFGVVAGDDVRAYPQKVLVWHEICNDVLDGTPVSVTYCPLTGTVLGFERGETTFGVSGNLVNNNLVMYDRATDSRWPQALATAIEGPHRGESLRQFRLVWTTWGQWLAAHPDTDVLSTDTGYVRDYGGDPYGDYDPLGGYYVSSETIFPSLSTDDRLPTKRVVLGTRSSHGIVAFDDATLRKTGTLTASVNETDFLAVRDGRVGAGYVYRNPEGVTVTDVSGGTITLSTGETAPASNLPLPRVYAFDAMWFAWSGFYPGTAVVGGEDAEGVAGGPTNGSVKNPGGEAT